MSLLDLTRSLQSYLTTPPDQLEDVSHIYNQFIEVIIEHNQSYYQESDPLISDYEYDQLFDYLKQIEKSYPDLISPFSPTQRIAWQEVIQDNFKKATHEYPLLSLENSYDADDIHDRHDRSGRILSKNEINKKPKYLIQPKYDGISVALTYTDGILTHAITRGDGYTGDDITLNVKTIKNLPHKISYNNTLIVRGEIILPKSELARINTEREAAGEVPFANTRNAASGTIKLLDTSIVRSRKLVCYTYDILTEVEELITLESLWLPTYPTKNQRLTTKDLSIDQVISTCLDPYLQRELESADIDFDGLVIKVADPAQCNILWSTDHHPRRAIAYKYPAQQVTTQINSIDYQVGRTGIITPVANLAPVELSGVTISRASLHNFDFINTKDIRLHDTVRIQRSGEVIPYIVRIVAEARPTDATPIQKPTHCPVCDHHVEYDDIYIYCPNTHGCPAQRKERIIHYVSKQCMNIDGLGGKYIKILVDNGLLHNIADLYTLHEKAHTLRSLPWFADKRIDQILDQVELSKSRELWRLINGLGFPWIGKKLAKEIEKAMQESRPPLQRGMSEGQGDFSNNQQLENFITYLTNPERLTSIYGVGETIVEWLQHFFDQAENKEVLERLANYGIIFSPQTKDQKPKTSITGKHFSLTGSLGLPRPQIIEILEWYGAIFDDAPKQTTDFMLVGDKPWSKASKAESLWITIYRSIVDFQTDYPDITFPDTKKEEQTPQQMGLFG